MRFDFLDTAEQVTGVRLEARDLSAEEKKHNIRFPEVLKELYLISNGSYVRELSLQIEGAEYDVEEILPLTGAKMTMSWLKETFEDNSLIPASFYPVAIDSAEGTYFWDALTGEVWYVAENSEMRPDFMFRSIQEMFEAMNEAVHGDGYVREKREEGYHYLPTGSIVILRGGKRKVMIAGRGMMAEAEGKTWYFDYAAVPYPEGVRGDRFIYLNHSWIDRVIFTGYHDDEDTIVDLRLREYLRTHPDVPRYPEDRIQLS